MTSLAKPAHHKRCIVVALNGILANPCHIPDGAFVIGADSGACRLLERGIVAALAIGDFDSMQSATRIKLEAAGCEFISASPLKDETDGELALEAAIQFRPEHIHILGMDSGRFDMIITNLSLLFHVALEDIRTTCQFQDGTFAELIVPGSLNELSTKSEGLLSLLPLTDEVYVETLTGVQWPLKNETIFRKKARTVSNRVLSEDAAPVKIAIKSGRVLVVGTSLD